MCFESWERRGKPLYLHQHLHPKKVKKVYKGRDLVTGTTRPSTHSHRQTTPLPLTLHLFSTNPQEHPGRRTRKG
jgi:hypothetical protein